MMVMGAATKVIWENTEQKSHEILTERTPASLGTANLGTRPGNQKHPWEVQLGT